MQTRRFPLLLLAAALPGAAQEPRASLSAAEIMSKVAVNQDREQSERSAYIYQQNIRVATRRKDGKLLREEVSDLLVAPTPNGADRKRQSIKGRYWEKGRYVEFHGEPVPKSDTLDGGLTSGFRNDLLNDRSKDGIAKDLFPLTSDQQKEMRFELAGEQAAAGRKAYRIRFAPKDRDELTWAGEALIDQEEFEPISVNTRLSRRLPFFVRSVLGTDVPGLGFNTQYTRVEKNVWFPVSFGTEFRLHAVFFINRTITVSMKNSDFRRAASDSQIRFGGEP